MTQSLIFNGTLIDGRGARPSPMARCWSRRPHCGGRGGRPSRRGRMPRPSRRGGWILPGLIDTHVHLMLEGLNIPRMLTTPFSYNFYKALSHMRRTIDAGITTVRDAGGADLGLKAGAGGRAHRRTTDAD